MSEKETTLRKEKNNVEAKSANAVNRRRLRCHKMQTISPSSLGFLFLILPAWQLQIPSY